MRIGMSTKSNQKAGAGTSNPSPVNERATKEQVPALQILHLSTNEQPKSKEPGPQIRRVVVGVDSYFQLQIYIWQKKQKTSFNRYDFARISYNIQG